MVEIIMGMNEVFADTIGQRIQNKLIQYAYANDFQGNREQLERQIKALANVIQITRESIADVIEAEVEVLAARDSNELDQTQILFMSGLLHAHDMITKGTELIGKVDLE